MSKYIKTIPLSSIERMAIVLGNGRLAGKVKQDTGADIVCNAGFYGGNGKATHNLKADGVVLGNDGWTRNGYAWDAGGDIRMEVVPSPRRSYIGAVELLTPMVGIKDKIPYDPQGELGGKRGRTAMALGVGTLILYCSGDGTGDAATPETLRSELYKLGAETALMLDGGGSSQCDFGGGGQIYSSRKVHSYLCVWLKKETKEDKPVDGIKQGIMTRSDCYKAGRTIIPKGIMVHSTATPGVMAQALRDSWDAPGVAMAVHAFVDDKETIQALPWTHRAWHAGGKANDTHISFEICEPQECRLLPIEWVPLKRGSSGWAVTRLQMELQARGYYTGAVDGSFGPATEAVLKACQQALGLVADGSCGPATLAALAKRSGSYLAYRPEDTAAYFEAAYANAVGLCAMLCKEYGLDPMRDILCHSEGYKAGIASNHADVMHWFPRHGKSMDDFRRAVKAAMEPVEDYREAVKARFGLADETVDYLAAYKYGPDLLRKLATQG